MANVLRSSLVSDFLSTELVDWPLSYEADLLALDVFEDKPENLALLRTRIMQHVGVTELVLLNAIFLVIISEHLGSLKILYTNPHRWGCTVVRDFRRGSGRTHFPASLF